MGSWMVEMWGFTSRFGAQSRSLPKNHVEAQPPESFVLRPAEWSRSRTTRAMQWTCQGFSLQRVLSLELLSPCSEDGGRVEYLMDIVCKACGPTTVAVCGGCPGDVILGVARERPWDVFCTDTSESHRVLAVDSVRRARVAPLEMLNPVCELPFFLVFGGIVD